MAINCDPDLYDYAGAGSQCAQFPANKTPVTMFATFTGIEIGQAWAPGDVAAPNIILELTQIAACTWQLINADFHCTFNLGGPASINFFDPDPPNDAFFVTAGMAAGTFAFVSQIIDVPGNLFFGGTCIMQSPLDDDAKSLQTVLEELNIDPRQPTYDNPRALDTTHTWHTIGNEDDTTVVKIKYDHT